ncbi:DUF4232 domain-containing protein [Streptomyces sp. GESEQ-35]|uniref:DUF4232 domain-containing protein n=1 Tax=Streptomyces sp. GESEQ-35 TaxID=2812657 RepID=UPI001B31B40A|nr:DUF4232 domain-containing protein [Streptomyces sp. GESEQ-35]
MANTHRSVRPATLLASAVAVLGLLAGCGNGSDSSNTASTPQTLPGTAGPATGTTTPASETPSTARPSATTEAPGSTTPSSSPTKGTEQPATSTRCHTSELSASVGRNNPGAGQENYPVVLTNTSSRTCTVRGYPGAAFIDASGKQLGPDPVRSSASPTTVTLKPGSSAWAGLTYSNPEISGARTATPAALLVTPPDERDSLKVAWTAGEVPVGGNASSVRLTVFSPGTGD